MYKRTCCTSLIGQLKSSDGIVLTLKFTIIAAGACVCAAWAVCLFEFRVSEHKAQQMRCVSPCTDQAVNPIKAIYSDGSQIS